MSKSRYTPGQRSTPGWWNNLHHERPTRRKVKALERQAVRGVDPDALNWPKAKRPHNYYW